MMGTDNCSPDFRQTSRGCELFNVVASTSSTLPSCLGVAGPLRLERNGSTLVTVDARSGEVRDRKPIVGPAAGFHVFISHTDEGAFVFVIDRNGTLYEATPAGLKLLRSDVTVGARVTEAIPARSGVVLMLMHSRSRVVFADPALPHVELPSGALPRVYGDRVYTVQNDSLNHELSVRDVGSEDIRASVSLPIRTEITAMALSRREVVLMSSREAVVLHRETLTPLLQLSFRERMVAARIESVCLLDQSLVFGGDGALYLARFGFSAAPQQALALYPSGEMKPVRVSVTEALDWVARETNCTPFDVLRIAFPMDAATQLVMACSDTAPDAHNQRAISMIKQAYQRVSATNRFPLTKLVPRWICACGDDEVRVGPAPSALHTGIPADIGLNGVSGPMLIMLRRRVAGRWQFVDLESPAYLTELLATDLKPTARS